MPTTAADVDLPATAALPAPGAPGEDVVHGLRRRWVDLPGTVTGALTFGVGAADEPPHLVGITHLAEHLVFRAMGGVRPRANGVTGADTVTFFATGTTQEVVAFLHDVAAAVREPRFTDDDLRRELAVVRAEAPQRTEAASGLLTFRFGLGGPGNAHAGWPALPSVTAEEVRAWIARWFVADNAALVLTTTPPADLDVVLPRGAGPVRTVPAPLVRVPTLVETSKVGVAASLLVLSEHAGLLEELLVHELLDDLRMRRGLIYSVDTEVTPIGPDLAQVDLVLDPVAADVPATVEAVVTALRRLGRDGFSAQARVEVASSVRADRGWWDEPAHAARRWAEAYLIGRALPPSAEEEVERACSTPSEVLRSVLATALETLVVAYDESVGLGAAVAALHLEVEDGVLFRETAARVPRGVRMRRRRGAPARAGVDATHVWGDVDGEVRRVALRDLVLVVRAPEDAVTFVDRAGRAWTTDPGEWRRGGRELLEAITAGAVDAEVRDGTWPDRTSTSFAERSGRSRTASHLRL